MCIDSGNLLQLLSNNNFKQKQLFELLRLMILSEGLLKYDIHKIKLYENKTISIFCSQPYRFDELREGFQRQGVSSGGGER